MVRALIVIIIVLLMFSRKIYQEKCFDRLNKEQAESNIILDTLAFDKSTHEELAKNMSMD